MFPIQYFNGEILLLLDSSRYLDWCGPATLTSENNVLNIYAIFSLLFLILVILLMCDN